MVILIYDNKEHLELEIFGYKYIVNHKLKSIFIDNNVEYNFKSIEHINTDKGHFLKVVER